jgi:FixJ family two-component response regulator
MANRVIFNTGDAPDASTQEFLKDKALLLISKPFNRITLLEKVNGALKDNSLPEKHKIAIY